MRVMVLICSDWETEEIHIPGMDVAFKTTEVRISHEIQVQNFKLG